MVELQVMVWKVENRKKIWKISLSLGWVEKLKALRSISIWACIAIKIWTNLKMIKNCLVKKRKESKLYFWKLKMSFILSLSWVEKLKFSRYEHCIGMKGSSMKKAKILYCKESKLYFAKDWKDANKLIWKKC